MGTGSLSRTKATAATRTIGPRVKSTIITIRSLILDGDALIQMVDGIGR